MFGPNVFCVRSYAPLPPRIRYLPQMHHRFPRSSAAEMPLFPDLAFQYKALSCPSPSVVCGSVCPFSPQSSSTVWPAIQNRIILAVVGICDQVKLIYQFAKLQRLVRLWKNCMQQAKIGYIPRRMRRLICAFIINMR